MPITIGGQTYTDQQIKDFYAGGGNDVQFAQQAGITDQGLLHDLAMQARGIAGASNPTGDAALQQQFQRYQQANPQGAYANNYQGFINDLGAGTANAIRSGTYTGAAISPTDYTPGGIYGPGSSAYGQPGYASGLGARGNNDGWGAPTMVQPQPAQPSRQAGYIQTQPSQLGFGYAQPRYSNQPSMYPSQPRYQSQSYQQPRYSTQPSQFNPFSGTMQPVNMNKNMGFTQNTANATGSQFSGLNGRGLL